MIISSCTYKDIQFILNEEFMPGRISADNFIGTMLAVVEAASLPAAVQDAALHSIAISLGHLARPGQMLKPSTYEIIRSEQGLQRRNDIAKALTSEHIGILRSQHTKKLPPIHAEDAYFLALLHVPESATPKDIHVLCNELAGEPTSIFNLTDRRTYYPQKIYNVIMLASGVFAARADLLDSRIFVTARRLPENLQYGVYMRRPAYDGDMTKDKIWRAGQELANLCSKIEALARPEVSRKLGDIGPNS